ncbi:hypothetical protein NLI96_g8603 [Meripilus lineatus]|uniref:Uncharacterized protein n=1 Tax=Meripilus lineatus TaxID=2056292 RepID=A0AAD5YB01_9APHY|nr:hypothetical protein NLI96_g8603 [Physisporinus lineatus]
MASKMEIFKQTCLQELSSFKEKIESSLAPNGSVAPPAATRTPSRAFLVNHAGNTLAGKTIADLENLVAQHEASLDQHTGTISVLTTQLSVSEDKNSSLTHQLEHSQRKGVKSDALVISTRRILAQTEAALEAERMARQNLRENAQKKIDVLRRAADEYHNHYSKAASRLKEANKTCERHGVRISGLQKAVASNQASLHRTTLELKKTQKKCFRLFVAFSGSQRNRVLVQGKLESAEKEKRRLRNGLMVARKDADRAREHAEQKEVVVSRLRHTLKTTGQQLDAANEDRHALNTQLAAKDAQLSSIQQECDAYQETSQMTIADMQRQIDALTNQLRERDATILEAREQNEHNQKELGVAKYEIAALKIQVKEKDAEISEVRNAFAIAERDFTEELNLANDLIASLETVVEEQDAELAAVYEELDTVSTQRDARFAQLLEEEDAHSATFDELVRTRDELGSAYDTIADLEAQEELALIHDGADAAEEELGNDGPGEEAIHPDIPEVRALALQDPVPAPLVDSLEESLANDGLHDQVIHPDIPELCILATQDPPPLIDDPLGTWTLPGHWN